MSNSRRMKQRPQERLGRLFKDWVTHLWWEQKFSFGLSMLPEQVQTSGGLQALSWKAENKSTPLVVNRRRSWVGFSFADSCLNKGLFKTGTYLWLKVDLERCAVGTLEGVRPDDCRKDWRLVVGDGVSTRDLSKVIYVKCWWIFLSMEPVNLLKILKTDGWGNCQCEHVARITKALDTSDLS